jgi:hypothetical protein
MSQAEDAFGVEEGWSRDVSEDVGILSAPAERVLDCAATASRTWFTRAVWRPASSAVRALAAGAMKPADKSSAVRLTAEAIEVCCSDAMTPNGAVASVPKTSVRGPIGSRAAGSDGEANFGSMSLAVP